MAKKVLVIDDPKTCRGCPCLSRHGEDLVCGATHKVFRDGTHTLIYRSEDFVPGWCPLVDMPDYKMDWSGDERSYEAGFNDAIDMINK